MGNLRKRMCINIIKISKSEALELNKKYGVPYGEYGISHTWNKSKHYFLCESKKNISNLRKIRNKIITK